MEVEKKYHVNCKIIRARIFAVQITPKEYWN